MAPSRKRIERAERSELERAMEGVTPLVEGPSRIAVERRAAARSPHPPPRPPGFETATHGERVEGLAAGGDRRQLLRLERGEIPVDHTLDLHGLGAEAAREAVLATLERAPINGWRVILIVHGRGRRSPEGPVLKRALPGWLAAAPRRRVLGFISADPARGGAGATLVLLRKRR